jgi:hypothetical protein
VGFFAGLILPNRGEAVMSVHPSAGGGEGSNAGDGAASQLVTELLITSSQAGPDEHWRYGSRIDAGSGHAREAWTSYKWRDKEKAEREPIARPAVLDIVSAIYAIRRDLPQRPTSLTVWSDGKIYPVEVIPRGFESPKVGGERVTTLHYTVRGDKNAEGRYWKGKLELWLARDAAVTPLRIHIERSLANLRLEIDELPGGP